MDGRDDPSETSSRPHLQTHLTPNTNSNTNLTTTTNTLTTAQPPPLSRFHSSISHASAFEADDELSTSASRDPSTADDDELLASDSYAETMSPANSHHHHHHDNRSTHAPAPVVRYPGEDTRRELLRRFPSDVLCL